MDDQLAELVWRGVLEANPWWSTGEVPQSRSEPFRRHAFDTVYSTLTSTDAGRGLVVLGPRRVGKTVLVHQVIEQLLADRVDAQRIVFLALDDVALRDRDLGDILRLVETRQKPTSEPRFLLLDEVQHSPDWSGWLKRIADRRDPYIFLATGSSATALRRGGQDAGLGRWREMTLFPWSFREHVKFQNIQEWSFEVFDRSLDDDQHDVVEDLGAPPPDELARLNNALVDYFLRGGFPEVAKTASLVEARRRLRQDILDRALGRDVQDVVDVNARVLERMFLRVCLNPGSLWNDSEVASDLGVSRATVNKYVEILERAFLIFRLPNLGSPIKGRPKMYLVAPALRQALLSLDDKMVRQPTEWGVLAENAVATALFGAMPDAVDIGFWRKGKHECDVVLVFPNGQGEFIEVKRGGKKNPTRGIRECAKALKIRGNGYVLTHDLINPPIRSDSEPVAQITTSSLALWLYAHTTALGGTLRIDV